MSNTLINWRFGRYHFLVRRDWPFVSLEYNSWWRVKKLNLGLKVTDD